MSHLYLIFSDSNVSVFAFNSQDGNGVELWAECVSLKFTCPQNVIFGDRILKKVIKLKYH